MLNMLRRVLIPACFKPHARSYDQPPDLPRATLPQAIAAMLNALKADPRDPEVLLALGVSHTNELDTGGQWCPRVRGWVHGTRALGTVGCGGYWFAGHTLPCFALQEPRANETSRLYPFTGHAGEAVGHLASWLSGHPQYGDVAREFGGPPDSSQALSHLVCEVPVL